MQVNSLNSILSVAECDRIKVYLMFAKIIRFVLNWQLIKKGVSMGPLYMYE